MISDRVEVNGFGFGIACGRSEYLLGSDEGYYFPLTSKSFTGGSGVVEEVQFFVNGS